MREEKPDSKKFEWEWSSKHTRLRYQLVISAIVVYYVCSYTLTNFTVPILFAKLEKGTGPNQYELIISAMVFYIFTLVSFFVRTKNETKTLSPNKELLNATIHTIWIAVQSLNDNFSKMGQNIKDDLNEISVLDNHLKRLDEKVTNFQNSKQNNFEEICDQAINATLSLIEIVSEKNKKTRPRDTIDEYNTIIQTALSLINSALADVKSDLEKIVAKESKDHKTYYWEREVLGLRLPILVSVVIVVWGLIQFLINCKEIIA